VTCPWVRIFTVRDRSRCPRLCRRKEAEVRHGEPQDGELIRPDTQFDVHQILGAVTQRSRPKAITGMMSDTRGARRRNCCVHPDENVRLCRSVLACPSWSKARGEVFHWCNCRHLAGSVGDRLRSRRLSTRRTVRLDRHQAWRKCLHGPDYDRSLRPPQWLSPLARKSLSVSLDPEVDILCW
jgi:hypothetical protein